MADGLKIKTLVVDDEQAAREATLKALAHFDNIDIVAAVNNSAGLVEALRQNKIDLVFLDIEMPDNNGFETARYIMKNYPAVWIVFVTGHAGFALDSYDFEPVDFIVKPINILRLERAIGRVSKKLTERARHKQGREADKNRNSF